MENQYDSQSDNFRDILNEAAQDWTIRGAVLEIGGRICSAFWHRATILSAEIAPTILSRLWRIIDPLKYRQTGEANAQNSVPYGLMAQDIIGSGAIVLLQTYTLYQIWTEIKAAQASVVKAAQQVPLIERSMQALMSEIRLLSELIDQVKVKPIDRVTLDDINRMILKISKVTMLYRKAERPISRLNFCVEGRIQSLTACQRELVKNSIINYAQIVSRLLELGIYASCPMGMAFWTMKGTFIALYVGIVAVQETEKVVCKEKLEKLQQKFAQLMDYDDQLAEIDELLLEKQNQIDRIQSEYDNAIYYGVIPLDTR